MKIRVEPFIQGFLVGMKPQMTPHDRELFSLIFKAHKPLRYSSKEETNPKSPSFYFRLGASHLNVLLPVWLLNGQKSSKNDRFRIACSDDHSFILDTRESLIYDPTTEAAYERDEYGPFRLMKDWKEETMMRFRDELHGTRLIVCSFGERVEHIPAIYDPFVAFALKHRLGNKLQGFRFGLKFEGIRKEVDEHALKNRELYELVMTELWERAQARAA